MGAPYVLTAWAVHQHQGTPWMAPEQVAALPRCLSGLCPDRAVALGLPPDERIATGDVVAVDRARRVVVTRSGSVYTLSGPPADEYAAWCKAHGYEDALDALTRWEV